MMATSMGNVIFISLFSWGKRKTKFCKAFLHFGILHEIIPQQAGPVIFDHDDDRPLIDGEVGIGIPIPGLIEGIIGPSFTDNFIIQGPVKIIHGPKRLDWAINY